MTREWQRRGNGTRFVVPLPDHSLGSALLWSIHLPPTDLFLFLSQLSERRWTKRKKKAPFSNVSERHWPNHPQSVGSLTFFPSALASIYVIGLFFVNVKCHLHRFSMFHQFRGRVECQSHQIIWGRCGFPRKKTRRHQSERQEERTTVYLARQFLWWWAPCITSQQPRHLLIVSATIGRWEILGSCFISLPSGLLLGSRYICYTHCAVSQSTAVLYVMMESICGIVWEWSGRLRLNGKLVLDETRPVSL